MAERSQIDEIKERLDIVEIARKYIRADFKNSGRNTFTLCPFHNEKTPSFSLNSDLGIYKCFGCGESGDVITLIQKLEGVDFSKALEISAEYAGITLKETLSPKDKAKAKERKEAQEVINIAAEFFHYLFMKHKSGEDARDYVRKRKVRKKEVKEFKLGFAPNGFEHLKKFMTKKGYSSASLIQFGLLTNKNNRVFDKFRNRLMFPIFNHRGEIVGFSGRTLEKDGIPKYLNSPETIIYKKSDIVYGLYQARDAIRKKDFAIIAEGNFEPLTSRKAGIDNVVVPMGTSLTNGQLKLIRRYTDNIYFAFDTDAAGFKALQRNSQIALKIGFNIKVVNLGEFKDPDEMISQDPNLWKDAVNSAVDLVDFLTNKYSEELNLNSASDKSKLVKQIKPFLDLLQDNVQVDHYVNKLANLLGVSKNSIRQGVISPNKAKRSEKEQENESTFESTNEDYLISILLNFPDLENDISKINFNKTQEKILKLKDMLDSIKDIREQLDENQKKYFDNIVMMNIPKFDTDEASKEIKKETRKIQKMQARQRMGIVKEKIKLAEEKGANIEPLLQEIQELNKILKE